MIHARFDPPNSGYGESVTVLLDAIDPSGGLRWTQPLPDKFLQQSSFVLVGVDRQGNVLALWKSDQRYGKDTWAGQWFDHAGTSGPVFQAFSGGAIPSQLYERVGNGPRRQGIRGAAGAGEEHLLRAADRGDLAFRSGVRLGHVFNRRRRVHDRHHHRRVRRNRGAAGSARAGDLQRGRSHLHVRVSLLAVGLWVLFFRFLNLTLFGLPDSRASNGSFVLEPCFVR